MLSQSDTNSSPLERAESSNKISRLRTILDCVLLKIFYEFSVITPISECLNMSVLWYDRNHILSFPLHKPERQNLELRRIVAACG